MNKHKKNKIQKERRAHRTRARLSGTPQRPRLSVHRSLSHIRVQLIDDTCGQVLAYADDRDLKGKKTERAYEVGKLIAQTAVAKKITTVIFDRGANRYHGRIKALADGARKNGLNF